MNEHQPETQTRSCLVHVFHSGNVLAAISAVKWYGLQRHGDERADVVTLAHNPGLSDDAAQESVVVVERMIASQGWPKPIVLTRGEMNEITGRWTPYDAVLHRFREKMGVGHFDEVYYTHDLVGRATELAMNTYPRATHITFGDALGNIDNKDYKLALLGLRQSRVNRQTELRTRLRPRRVLNVLKARLQQTILGGAEPFQACKAVLILPIDNPGDGLNDKDLFIVPKQLVLEILSNCQRAAPELAKYSRGLLTGTPAPHFLMLLENFTDGGRTSFESEVAMYEEMMQSHVPQGATVFIKAHPNSVAAVDEALCSRLSPHYATQVVSRDFRRYPVELWSDLVATCQVISMGYPGISLAFLYDKPVIYPFSPSLVETYFHQRVWNYYKYLDLVTREKLANLATWDGQSILWKGSMP